MRFFSRMYSAPPDRDSARIRTPDERRGEAPAGWRLAMPRRSFWAWGNESDVPSQAERDETAVRLSRRYGVELESPPVPTDADLELRPPRIQPPGALSAFAAVDTHERAAHTYGKSFIDTVRAFNRD